MKGRRRRQRETNAQEPGKGHPQGDKGRRRETMETKGDKGRQNVQEPGKGHPHEGRQRETKGDKGRHGAQEPGNAHQNAGNSLNEFRTPTVKLFGEK